MYAFFVSCCSLHIFNWLFIFFFFMLSVSVADYISRPESQSRQNLPQKENHAGPEPKVQTQAWGCLEVWILFCYLRASVSIPFQSLKMHISYHHLLSLSMTTICCLYCWDICWLSGSVALKWTPKHPKCLMWHNTLCHFVAFSPPLFFLMLEKQNASRFKTRLQDLTDTLVSWLSLATRGVCLFHCAFKCEWGEIRLDNLIHF